MTAHSKLATVGILLLSAGTAAASVFAACNTYDESLLLPGGDDSGTNLTLNRGLGFWSELDREECPSAGRPSLSDKPRATPGPDLDPIVVGLIHLDNGTLDPVTGEASPEAFRSLGFDLDGLCTGRTTTCSRGQGPACKPLRGEIPIDGEYCRDNALGNLASTLSYAQQVTSELGYGNFDCQLCAGNFGFLVRVSGYNGEANDDAIEVDFFPAVGLETPLPLGCQEQVPESACFRSFMPWKIDRKVVTGATPSDSLSTFRSVAGYVRDHQVVVFLPETMPIYFPGSHADVKPLSVTVRRGFLTGKISRGDDGTWRVDDGLIGGSTRISDLLESLESIGLCPGDSNYIVAQGVIENVADVLSSGELDENADCDAVSIGMGFRAIQATLGEAVEAPVYDYCSPSDSDAGP